MHKGEWLPLLNYSTKHSISLSTLRRRIKAGSIEFKLESGKYFILDEKASTPATQPATALRSLPEYSPESAPKATPKITIGPVTSEYSLAASSFVEASVLTSANRLVEEIKSAYAKILQEKEEQIAQLKEEVVDLRMLVRILEESKNPTEPKSHAATVNSMNEAAAIQKFHQEIDEAQRNSQINSQADSHTDSMMSSTLTASLNPNEEFFFSDFQNRDI